MGGMDAFEEKVQEGAKVLQNLERRRQQCEMEGRFYEAQECVDQMREFSVKQGKRLAKASREANAQEKQYIQEKQRLELLTFTKLWEEKLDEYEQQAKEIVKFVKARQAKDRQEQEEGVRQQLMSKRPRFSKQVLHLRELLERLVSQRKYIEAEEIRKKLKPLELEEVKKFDESLGSTFNKKAKALQTKDRNELNALNQRIQSGRDELKAQRRADFERLLQHHQNVLNELAQRTRVHISKTQEYISKHISVLQQVPNKTTVDYARTPRCPNPPSYMVTTMPQLEAMDTAMDYREDDESPTLVEQPVFPNGADMAE
eukprot:TRINITY_DN69156_c0_g1_i1.p1 TRINITY_DN69156_c0_g1~~TRINITY_DN69156_c0_g1_i1.p1  ORF type:complete len:315 (-),score=51.88 TRINITY_DN69156_c0_g1_i1:115-1059(-)